MAVLALINPPPCGAYMHPYHNGAVLPHGLIDRSNITGSMPSHLLDLHEARDICQEAKEVFPKSLPVWPVERAWEIVWTSEVMERSCQPWFHGRILLFLEQFMDQSLQIKARWGYVAKNTTSIRFAHDVMAISPLQNKMDVIVLHWVCPLIVLSLVLASNIIDITFSSGYWDYNMHNIVLIFQIGGKEGEGPDITPVHRTTKEAKHLQHNLPTPICKNSLTA